MLVDKLFKFTFTFFIFCSNSRCVDSKEKLPQLNRSKRTLIWQEGASRLQIITGFGVPVDLRLETVIIAGIMKGLYRLPSNISDIVPFGNVYYARRKKRSLSRWDIYDLLASLWQMRGFGGKSCILRAICDLSHRPVDKNHGLFDELIHAIFNPSGTKEVIRDHGDNEYYAAQLYGKRSGEFCKSKFPDCGLDMVDMFTLS